jgi:hypothetical protein
LVAVGVLVTVRVFVGVNVSVGVSVGVGEGVKVSNTNRVLVRNGVDEGRKPTVETGKVGCPGARVGVHVAGNTNSVAVAVGSTIDAGRVGGGNGLRKI